MRKVIYEVDTFRSFQRQTEDAITYANELEAFLNNWAKLGYELVAVQEIHAIDQKFGAHNAYIFKANSDG